MKQETYDHIISECKTHNSTCIIVSKYRSEEELLSYYDTGHRDFAENRVQELCAKQAHLPKDIRWHMIGHLQSNKVKYIAPFITCIHSVHSISLIKEIEKQAAKANRVLPILIQFNLAKEDSKSGFSYENWKDVFAYVTTCPHIKAEGIMVIGPHSDDDKQIAAVFEEASTLLHEIQTRYPNCTQLSMGMSNDYKIALEKGATMIRVGSILF